MSERKELAARLRHVAKVFFADGASAYGYLRAAADLLDPPAQGRTVRVRVVCAVTRGGTFSAHGDSGMVDPAVIAIALDGAWRDEDDVAGTPAQIRWVEAEVPAWEPPPTVEGTVQP